MTEALWIACAVGIDGSVERSEPCSYAQATGELARITKGLRARGVPVVLEEGVFLAATLDGDGLPPGWSRRVERVRHKKRAGTRSRAA